MKLLDFNWKKCGESLLDEIITDDWKILSIKRGSCDKSLMDNVFFDLQEGIVRELELIFTREWPVVYDSSPEINSTPFTLFGRDFFVYHDAYQMKHMECWVLNEKEMTHYNIKNTALFSPPTKWKRNGKTIWGKRSNSTIDLPF